MSLMQDAIAADVSRLFLTDFAETVVFTPEGGPSRSISGVIEEQKAARVYEGPHVLKKRTVAVFVARSEISGIDTLRRGDVLTWQGLDWGNPEVIEADNDSQSIRFHRSEPEATRAGRRTGSL
jgi:hypothetical protein